jgi:hypothetical protein
MSLERVGKWECKVSIIFKIWLFLNNLVKVWFLEILNKEILREQHNGQVNCVDLFTWIRTKFILYFLRFLLIYMSFGCLNKFLEI